MAWRKEYQHDPCLAETKFQQSNREQHDAWVRRRLRAQLRMGPMAQATLLATGYFGNEGGTQLKYLERYASEIGAESYVEQVEGHRSYKMWRMKETA